MNKTNQQYGGKQNKKNQAIDKSYLLSNVIAAVVFYNVVTSVDSKYRRI